MDIDLLNIYRICKLNTTMILNISITHCCVW